MYELIDGCRSCGSTDLEQILSLGDTPLADRLLDTARLNQPEPKCPLDVVFCPDCSLVQIRATVEPEILFDDDYPYFSSFSDELLDHSRANADRLVASRGLGSDSLVVEIASNDGYMLKNFKARGIPVLGIDPVPGPAEVAIKQGIPTLQEFFGLELAEQMAAEGTPADIVLANNVLAHVKDLNGFVAGIERILKPSGIVVIEVPYVRDLIDQCEFDTIYHEHLCYFSVTALSRLFERHGLSLSNVEHYPIHGGSLRLFATKHEPPSDAVRAYLKDEVESGLTTSDYYRNFAARVRQTQQTLREMIRSLKHDGHRIAAYGAAAKGAVLLNSSGIDGTLIDFVVDRNLHKHGRFMPGVRIPIYDPAKLLEEHPAYTLLLSWNFKDEILLQQQEYRDRGGRMIVPIPTPQVV